MFKLNRGADLKTKTPHAPYEEYLQLLTSDPEIEHAYQTLLEGLYLRDRNHPIRTILITSAQPGEGKTTVTVNVALMAMLAGKNVLLVDADLRRPRLHQIFGLDNKAGFADLFCGELGVRDVIHVVEAPPTGGQGPSHLSVITSGSTGTINTILSMAPQRLRDLLQSTGQAFDFVFLDSPPALAVMDSLFIAPAVDTTIMVLNTGVVTEKDAQSAKQRIEQAGGRIFGAVMNRFKEKLHGPGYCPYYRDYYQKG